MNKKYSCPKCGMPLVLKEKSYFCEKGHCYDVAGEGYVNLLTADKKHSRAPGDSVEMVRARYDFLEKGYYAPLAAELSDIITALCPNGTVLDAGCGSGYYTRVIKKDNNRCAIYAVDISKEAVRLGAKRGGADYAVAGVYCLPFAASTFDAVLNVFSPFAFEEYARVLDTDGTLISVYPAAEHLIELKNLIYTDASYENDKDVSSRLFERIEHRNIRFKTNLTESRDITNLLAMTPYYFTSPRDRIKSVSVLDTLYITCDFYVDVMRKK